MPAHAPGIDPNPIARGSSNRPRTEDGGWEHEGTGWFSWGRRVQSGRAMKVILIEMLFGNIKNNKTKSN